MDKFSTNMDSNIVNKIAKAIFQDLQKTNSAEIEVFCEACTTNKIENWNFAILTQIISYYRHSI